MHYTDLLYLRNRLLILACNLCEFISGLAQEFVLLCQIFPGHFELTLNFTEFINLILHIFLLSLKTEL